MPLRYAFIAVLILLPALSRSQEATTVGGYGELHYNEPDGAAKGVLDLHRFVIYLGHSFNEKLSFKSEMEIEHTKIETGDPKEGEVAVEQAYLDWHFSGTIGMKAGLILAPVGIINQFHEPPAFNGVERPNFDDVIIPTTWRESGGGIYGSLAEGVNYQLYVVAGLQAEGFDAAQGIREGRQEAHESAFVNPSLTGRLEFVPAPDLKVAGSFFTGSSTGGADSLGSGMVTLLAADAQYGAGRFAFRGAAAFISVADADRINAAFGKDVGDDMYGVSVEGAWNLLPSIADAPDEALNLFVRYEKYNTQSKVTGFAADPLNDRHDVTAGATFKPTFNTAFKVDYQWLGNAADATARQLNFGVGYMF